MKPHYFIILASLLTSTQAFADLPAPVQNADSELISAQQLTISATAQNKLKAQLEPAVFRLFAKQPAMHSLAQTGVSFDGAAVAVTTETVKDIISKDELVEVPAEPEQKKQSSSMFGRGLDRASSHFRNYEKPDNAWTSERQFYLTTADWLTNSNEFEIEIFGQKVKAKLDYRDDAQNVAVLSTPQNTQIKPVEVYSAENPIPGIVFVLLNPNSIYESLTTHVLTVTQEHLYGTTNLTARNGYPLFTSTGQLAGLVVGPDSSRKTASVVHTRVLDRALHPEKYNRTKVEEIKLEEY